MSASQNGNRRLDSWKEIAAHLGRNERTAIRWEKKGLPVHRVPGGQRQAVFAYTEEIDAWLVSQDGKVAAANMVAVVQTPEPVGNHSGLLANDPVATVKDAALPATSVHGKKWRVLAAVVCALTLAGIISVRLAGLHASEVPPPFLFTPLTGDGELTTFLRTDGTKLYLNEEKGARTVLVSRPITGGPISQIPTPFINVSLQDVSNDGRNLLVTSSDGVEREQPLWTITIQGGTPRRVGNVLCQTARWSPNNRRIACASGTSIVIVASDGSDPHNIASFESVPFHLLWSPDGRRIRFLLQNLTTHDFSAWEMTIGTESSREPTALSRLADGKDACLDWTWTNKGKSFACLKSDPTGEVSLVVTPSEEAFASHSGREAKFPIQIQKAVGLAPGKSDNCLYVLMQNPSRGELLKFDPKRKVLETYLHGSSAYYVSFSRDGRWMSYVDAADQSLWRSHADGSEPLQLTRPPEEVEISSWSPDGNQIAYMARSPGKPWRIFLIDRDGGTPQESSPGNDNQGGPSWSPDGKSLVYANVDCSETQSCWIRRVNLASRQLQILPGSNGLRTARWSPNGKYVAALRFQAHELLLFDFKAQHWTSLAHSVTGDNIHWSGDSRYVFVNSPQQEKLVVERIRIRDGKRATVMNLDSPHNGFGTLGSWIGLTPDNSPMLFKDFVTSAIYSLEWSDQ